jgi:hypothetical protein
MLNIILLVDDEISRSHETSNYKWNNPKKNENSIELNEYCPNMLLLQSGIRNKYSQLFDIPS